MWKSAVTSLAYSRRRVCWGQRPGRASLPDGQPPAPHAPMGGHLKPLVSVHGFPCSAPRSRMRCDCSGGADAHSGCVWVWAGGSQSEVSLNLHHRWGMTGCGSDFRCLRRKCLAPSLRQVSALRISVLICKSSAEFLCTLLPCGSPNIRNDLRLPPLPEPILAGINQEGVGVCAALCRGICGKITGGAQAPPDALKFWCCLLRFVGICWKFSGFEHWMEGFDQTQIMCGAHCNCMYGTQCHL